MHTKVTSNMLKLDCCDGTGQVQVRYTSGQVGHLVCKTNGMHTKVTSNMTK
jgi:hypothetical protein